VVVEATVVEGAVVGTAVVVAAALVVAAVVIGGWAVVVVDSVVVGAIVVGAVITITTTLAGVVTVDATGLAVVAPLGGSPVAAIAAGTCTMVPATDGRTVVLGLAVRAPALRGVLLGLGVTAASVAEVETAEIVVVDVTVVDPASSNCRPADLPPPDPPLHPTTMVAAPIKSATGTRNARGLTRSTPDVRPRRVSGDGLEERPSSPPTRGTSSPSPRPT